MHLLGRYLPQHKRVRIALRAFYGVSFDTAERLLARLSIPNDARVCTLTEQQITALSAYLSSPTTSGKSASTPVSAPGEPLTPAAEASPKGKVKADPLDTLLIETDLRRQRKADINHHRIVGSYVGRRHAMALPVRGQNTRNNGVTAKKLNSLNRRQFG
jgi:small subunit ribosomal protein S13